MSVCAPLTPCGLAGDGVTDDSAALQALLASAMASSQPVDLWPGAYLCNSSIVLSGSGKLRIRGHGGDLTKLVFPSGNGLQVTYTDATKPPDISGVAFISNAAPGGTGLYLTTSHSVLQVNQGPLLESLVFIGWNNALWLNESWFPKITDVLINGINAAAPPFPSAAGIVLNNVQAVTIRDPRMFWLETGIVIEGTSWSEGTQITGGELVGVDVGINDVSTYARSGTSIHDMHINAYRQCINVNIRGQISIHDCLFFKVNISTEYWQGIVLTGSTTPNIHDCQFLCPGASGSADGITIVNGFCAKIGGNVFNYWTPSGTAIVLEGTTDYCEINRNSRMGYAGPASIFANLGSGTNNRLYDNAPDQGVPA